MGEILPGDEISGMKLKCSAERLSKRAELQETPWMDGREMAKDKAARRKMYLLRHGLGASWWCALRQILYPDHFSSLASCLPLNKISSTVGMAEGFMDEGKVMEG